MHFEMAFLPASVVGALGAYWDLKERRLPNWLCAVFAMSAVAGLVASQGFVPLQSSVLHALIALVVGMLLFRIAMIGGGDAKFYAAGALGLPVNMALPFLGWTSAAGLVLFMFMFVARRIAHAPGGALRGWSLPYGVAIFFGFLAATQLSLIRPI